MNLISWGRQHVPEDADARRLALASLIDNIGAGIHLVLFPLYLVTFAGVPPLQVGACLTFAAVLGLVSAVPIGKAADVLSPQILLLLGTLLQAGVAVLFIFTRTVLVFGIAVCLGKVATQAVRLSRNLLTAHVGGESRNQLRGQVTVAVHVGCGVGEAISVVLLMIGNSAAYTAGFLINAASYVVAGVLQASIGSVPKEASRDGDSRPGGQGRIKIAVKDTRYAAVSLVNGLLYFHQHVLVLGVPLWIAATGSVPKWMASVIFPVNLLLIVALQMTASNRVKTVSSAGRAWRLSGYSLSVACLGIALATLTSHHLLALLLVIGAAVLFTVAEICVGAAEFELSLSLAPKDSRGLYQGVFVLGADIVDIVGPLSVALLCVSLGANGWVSLAVLFAVTGALSVRLTTWASQRGPATDSVTPQHV